MDVELLDHAELPTLGLLDGGMVGEVLDHAELPVSWLLGGGLEKAGLEVDFVIFGVWNQLLYLWPFLIFIFSEKCWLECLRVFKVEKLGPDACNNDSKEIQQPSE